MYRFIQLPGTKTLVGTGRVTTVGWLVGWLVGSLVAWLVGWSWVGLDRLHRLRMMQKME